jgi:DNA-binding transcriptional LysR family regulator
MDLENIKLKEIEVFLDLAKTQSIRELARQKNMKPSHISKLIQSLEKKLERPLVHRSVSGVESSVWGKEVIPYLEKIREVMEDIESSSRRDLTQFQFITVLTNAFFASHLLPAALTKICGEQKITFRILDTSPSQFVPIAIRGSCEVCVHLGKVDWPGSWQSQKVGQIQWVPCARAKHPIAKKTKLESLLKYPFVYPAYWTNEGVKMGDDRCPLPIQQRLRGHETSTAAAAIEVVLSSQQLGFLPLQMIKSYVDHGQIKVLEVVEWPQVFKDAYVSVKSDKVSQKFFKSLCEHLSESLLVN